MANPWSLYQAQPSFVLGFHGTEESVVQEVVSSKKSHLKKSAGRFEWLGHGIYFWENDPQRGLEWAETGNPKKPIAAPAVVGAIIDLGRCLDLTTRTGLDEVKAAYELLASSYKALSRELPVNSGGIDQFKRELDCQVIQALHRYRHDNAQPPYDSVRSPFPEDTPLYTGAGFRLKNHVQIAVLNPDCIKGYFHPIQK